MSGLMKCPDCGLTTVIAEMRSTASVPVALIDRGAVGVYIQFDSTEWEVEDVYCDDCGWNPDHRSYWDYEWMGNYPPESGEQSDAESRSSATPATEQSDDSGSDS